MIHDLQGWYAGFWMSDIMDQLDEFYNTGFLFDFGSAHKHISTKISQE